MRGVAVGQVEPGPGSGEGRQRHGPARKQHGREDASAAVVRQIGLFRCGAFAAGREGRQLQVIEPLVDHTALI